MRCDISLGELLEYRHAAQIADSSSTDSGCCASLASETLKNRASVRTLGMSTPVHKLVQRLCSDCQGALGVLKCAEGNVVVSVSYRRRRFELVRLWTDHRCNEVCALPRLAIAGSGKTKRQAKCPEKTEDELRP
jgi:hypothetical protein